MLLVGFISFLFDADVVQVEGFYGFGGLGGCRLVYGFGGLGICRLVFRVHAFPFAFGRQSLIVLVSGACSVPSLVSCLQVPAVACWVRRA
jgi:hypothetical protein